jgi:hypothetical protein
MNLPANSFVYALVVIVLILAILWLVGVPVNVGD